VGEWDSKEENDWQNWKQKIKTI